MRDTSNERVPERECGFESRPKIGRKTLRVAWVAELADAPEKSLLSMVPPVIQEND